MEEAQVKRARHQVVDALAEYVKTIGDENDLHLKDAVEFSQAFRRIDREDITDEDIGEILKMMVPTVLKMVVYQTRRLKKAWMHMFRSNEKLVVEETWRLLEEEVPNKELRLFKMLVKMPFLLGHLGPNHTMAEVAAVFRKRCCNKDESLVHHMFMQCEEELEELISDTGKIGIVFDWVEPEMGLTDAECDAMGVEDLEERLTVYYSAEERKNSQLGKMLLHLVHF